MPELRNIPLASTLATFGDRLAVVTPDGAELTYAQLAARVADVSEQLGGTRRLVLVGATNELQPLVTYLAAAAAGHPVLLSAPGPHWQTLIDTYDPDVLLDGGELRERRRGTAHELHPELAVLLSTSGTTGSPKLVRLSGENIQANASSIASYLDIRDTDRASAALPMHYCYGLSVINSNLARGAALLLTGESVLSGRFWATFNAYRGTSLHGVPYTFDLLRQAGFERMRLPGLRYVTQAGGALAPGRVRELARLGERDGWRFFVMYGQTEATARMAYLPPELAATHPSAVGVPIPGGSFEIAEDGELIYRGANVMLGYARRPADLALGRAVEALRTRDLARYTDDGLIEVTGRTSRIIKPFGLRVDLAHTERALADLGHPVACGGSDDALIVATTGDPGAVATLTRRHTGLPASHVRVLPVDEFPRLPTGKIDYPEIERRAEVAPPGGRSSSSLPDRFAAVLGQRRVSPDATFVGLGGDSLSYVRMSIEIERVLGYVPRDWPTTPVGELDRLARKRDRRGTMVETNIVLRAVAITLIVGTHIGLFKLMGGAHLLLVIAGWSFARFCLVPDDDRPSRSILRSATRIAVPAMIWLSFRVFTTDDITGYHVLLTDIYVRSGSAGYWFIEVLVHSLLVFAVLLAVPGVRRWERRYPYAFALVLLGIALLVHRTALDTSALLERHMATHGVLWFFVLGWLAHRAATSAQRLAVAGIAVFMLPGYFGDPVRETIIGAGLALLMLVPRLRLPRPAVTVIGPVASASLFIYLTHHATLDYTLGRMPGVLTLASCLAVGVLSWFAVEWLRRAGRSGWRSRAGGDRRRVVPSRSIQPE